MFIKGPKLQVVTFWLIVLLVLWALGACALGINGVTIGENPIVFAFEQGGGTIILGGLMVGLILGAVWALFSTAAFLFLTLLDDDTRFFVLPLFNSSTISQERQPDLPFKIMIFSFLSCAIGLVAVALIA